MAGAEVQTGGRLEPSGGGTCAGDPVEPERGAAPARSERSGVGRRSAASARSLLLGTPREVLARLAAHDPLGLRALAGRRLAERFLLMDAERVHLASLARIARRARNYRGAPALEAWIEREVDAAIDALREDEARAERSAALDAPQPGGERAADEVREGGAWRDLARPLGLAPEEMRGACARFNALPREEREAFVRLVLERRSPDELARASGRTLTELARRARRGIEAVLASGPQGSEERARARRSRPAPDAVAKERAPLQPDLGEPGPEGRWGDSKGPSTP